MKLISLIALVASATAIRFSKDKITTNPKGFTDANIQPNDGDEGADKWQMDRLKKDKAFAGRVEKAAGKAKTATSW